MQDPTQPGSGDSSTHPPGISRGINGRSSSLPNGSQDRPNSAPNPSINSAPLVGFGCAGAFNILNAVECNGDHKDAGCIPCSGEDIARDGAVNDPSNRIPSSPSPPLYPEEGTVLFQASWVNFKSNLKLGFARLYETKDMSDLTIACEGFLLKCHKLVLGLSSRYFREMFASVQCKHPVIILTGIKLKDIKNVLRFVYYGYVRGTPEDLEDFKKTAVCLLIDGAIPEEERSFYQKENSYTNTPPSYDMETDNPPEFRFTVEKRPIQMDRPIKVEVDSRRNSIQLSNSAPENGRNSAKFPSSVESSTKRTSTQLLTTTTTSSRRSSTQYSPEFNRRYETSPQQQDSSSQEYDDNSIGQDGGRKSIIIQRNLNTTEKSRFRPIPESTNLSLNLPETPNDLSVDLSQRISYQNMDQTRPDEKNSLSRGDGRGYLSPSPNGWSTALSPQDLSPGSDSRIYRPSRPPVISRRRRAASDPNEEEPYELSVRNAPYTLPNSSRLYHSGPSPSSISKTFRHHHQSYSGSWNLNSPYTVSSSDSVSLDGNSSSSQQFPLRLNHQLSRSSTGIPSGYTPHRHTLSGVSRSHLDTIPLHLINPNIPGLLSSRQSLPFSNHSNTQISSPSRIPTPVRHGGVIISAPSMRRSLPPTQSHANQNQSDQPHPSTLEILKAKIAAGQQVYTRGYRPDKNNCGAGVSGSMGQAQSGYNSIHNQPSSSFSIQSSSNPLQPMGLLGAPQQQQLLRPIARPKTKAIRSSQVPQSARYTAQEVDAMVDQVAHFVGNMVPCAVCQKYVKRERLRAHIHECHLLQGKRIICPHCGIGLKSKGSFRVHIWRHKRGALPIRGQNQDNTNNPNLMDHNGDGDDIDDYPEDVEDDEEFEESLRSRSSK